MVCSNTLITFLGGHPNPLYHVRSPEGYLVKYQEAFDQINEIMTMVGMPKLQPIKNCNDDTLQIDHLYNRYLDLYIEHFPQWAKFKSKPEMINDLGIQYLLKIRDAT